MIGLCSANARLADIFQAGMLLLASPAFASFHLMKIEAAMGGIGGDTTQQAVQLRMRAPGQNLVGSGQTRLIAWDAAGLNPVTLIAFPADVLNATQGSRILVVSPAFASAHPGIPGDFTMTSVIPSYYLPAAPHVRGRLRDDLLVPGLGGGRVHGEHPRLAHQRCGRGFRASVRLRAPLVGKPGVALHGRGSDG